ncbi:branched-chain amino acid ABC transporter permease [Spirochaetia bacterium]|nr:branched-chain amino acid ABC transporter permease [Spirochaetia bacterium]
MNRSQFFKAFSYSIPVLLGYLAIGIAFGLMLVDAGYPWWLALVMSVLMYAGAGQYLAIGLFAAGVTLYEAALVQIVVNARHIAYGLSLFKRLNRCGKFKYYIIFALTDETFALLSSVPEEQCNENHGAFMFYVALLDQFYWVAGSVIGAILGSILPFSMEGISFALTALFITLTLEQLFRIKKPGIFIVSAAVAVLSVIIFPAKTALLTGLILSLAVVALLNRSAPGKLW